MEIAIATLMQTMWPALAAALVVAPVWSLLERVHDVLQRIGWRRMVTVELRVTVRTPHLM